MAYKFLIQEQLKQNRFKGIKQSKVIQIQKDIRMFKQSYLTLQDFKIRKLGILMTQIEKQIQQISNYGIVRDYSTFKANVLHQYDIGNISLLSKCKIQQKKFNKVLKVLRDLSKIQVDDAVVYSLLFYIGIGVQENLEVAEKILESDFFNSDGRALLLKYKVNYNCGEDELQTGLLTKSCLLGNNEAFVEAANIIDIIQVPDFQRELILYSASAQLGSPIGMFNVAVNLEQGEGIEQNQKESIEYYYKALQKGYLNKTAKQFIDEYFKKNEGFRNSHKNYRVWNKDYDEYEEQEIILL